MGSGVGVRVLESDRTVFVISIVTLSKLLNHFELKTCTVGLIITYFMGVDVRIKGENLYGSYPVILISYLLPALTPTR